MVNATTAKRLNFLANRPIYVVIEFLADILYMLKKPTICFYWLRERKSRIFSIFLLLHPSQFSIYVYLGIGDVIEGSVTLWFPDTKPLDKVRHPYQRTYKPDKTARWETDEDYCNTYVKKTEPYSKGQRIVGCFTNYTPIWDTHF